MEKPSIGFIGQGYIGKNYADNLEERGYPVVRYSLEKPYTANKDKIKDCGIVFIAVPTPTTPGGFDGSAIESVLPLVGAGRIAVIKSTVIPGFTKKMQEKFPRIAILFSPEFLSVASAAYDVAHPFENVIGMPVNDAEHAAAAKKVLAVLPPAPHSTTTSSESAEVIKYAHNTFAYAKVVMMNLYYDVAQKFGANWDDIAEVLKRAPFVGPNHLMPIHKTGRGAGGFCLLKDFAAFRAFYEEVAPKDATGQMALRGLEQKNIDLLKKNRKDSDLIQEVYGENKQ